MNNFTPRAQQVLALARKEADRFNHNFVGTEHLLLGLIREGEGIAANVLTNLGLDLEVIRQTVESMVAAPGSTLTLGEMIPKTLAYVAVALLAYRGLYPRSSAPAEQVRPKTA